MEDSLFEGCEIIPSEDGCDTVLLPACTISPKRLAKQHQVMAASTTPDIQRYANQTFPNGTAIYEGLDGEGTQPNWQANLPNGRKVPFHGALRRDGTFTRRTDVEEYDPERLFLVGFVVNDIS